MTDEDDAAAAYAAVMAAQAPRLAAEEIEVERLGRAIGFGRLMQAAESVWRRVAIDNGTPGSEHTTGPCASMMEPCPCRVDDPAKDEWFAGGHCDWCCGAGRVTNRVARAMRAE